MRAKNSNPFRFCKIFFLQWEFVKIPILKNGSNAQFLNFPIRKCFAFSALLNP